MSVQQPGPIANSDQGFLQEPPELKNQYDDDIVLQNILKRILPLSVLQEIESDLSHFGERVVTDEITTAPGWKALNDVAAEEGLIAIGYERRYKEYSRVYQFAKQYLYAPSSAMYACPLSMTDGAARVLELIGTEEMKKQYYSRLISRDPAKFWTSGQWMTERPGGSDVSRSETQAKLLDPTTNTWSISGFKWFSSATTADLTMLLARSVNTQNGTVKTGSKGLSLYIAEMRLPNGQLNGVRVHRLKNKYGTKGLPTAELELNRMQAKMLGKPGRGVPCIAAILNITRIYACLGVVCSLRRSLAIAKDFAGKRQAFGKRLDQTPLHITTLADLELVFRAGAQLAFYCIQLLGRTECSHHGSSSNNDNEDMVILRFLTPIAKAYVCKMGVTACSEAMEALGGQGYMEEIGIGRQLRDAQVNTIWEGTTNVLAMDVLRVMRETKGQCLLTFEKVVKDKTKYAKAIFKDDQTTSKIIQAIDTAMQNIKKFVASSSIQENKAEVEANARQLTFALGRTLAGTLLLEQAAFDTAHDLKDAEEDILVAQRWCKAFEFTKPIIPVGPYEIQEEARIVFGHDAKI